MFNKEELETKSIVELAEIAQTYNINIEELSSPEEAVMRIMEAQENGTAEPVKRTRKRVIKKDTTDHVYSVTGTDGENLDSKEAKKKAKASTEIFSDPPKKRGRKSKKQLLEEAMKAEEEARAAAEANAAMNATEESSNTEGSSDTEENGAAEVRMDSTEGNSTTEVETTNEGEAYATGNTEDETSLEYNTYNGEYGEDYNEEAGEEVPEATFNEEKSLQKDQENIIAQLQEKMNAHNKFTEEAVPYRQDEVWDGDPGDGTDFIIIEDLPIEDSSAVPHTDIFDNPTTYRVTNKPEQDTHTPTYDFSKIIKTSGLVEVMVENYGFLRSSDYNYLSSPDDVYVPMPVIRKFGLKTGDVVECFVAPPSNNDKYFTLVEVVKINGRNPQNIRDRIPFEHLTPLFPDEKFNLCGHPATTNLSTRIVDLFAPIGKGQRALLVAQPKTGKTILMKDIANAIASSHPEAYLMMLLIDERPEEVTDMMRTVNAEVIASTFDEPAERHVKIAGLVLEKAKRMVECGHDVVIFLDSITRLARAYNTVAPASGKVLTGGVDANALQKPKRFFGAARNIEDGGSLTIIATALIDTGSKMDEVIFEEFKGTGNMELQLDRALANKRIFPAVNLIASSTRRDDLLQDKTTLDRMWIVRKFISDMNPIEAMTEIRERLTRTKDNDEFLLSINS